MNVIEARAALVAVYAMAAAKPEADRAYLEPRLPLMSARADESVKRLVRDLDRYDRADAGAASISAQRHVELAERLLAEDVATLEAAVRDFDLAAALAKDAELAAYAAAHPPRHRYTEGVGSPIYADQAERARRRAGRP